MRLRCSRSVRGWVLVLLLCILLLPALVFAAQPVVPAAAPADAIHARRAVSKVTIDGRLDEPTWDIAPAYDRFVENFPRDGAPAPAEFRTEVRVVYDDEFLYVGVRAFDPQPQLVNAQLSRRDTLPTSDYVQLVLDPMHQGNTGYSFIVNAAGVQRDLLLYGDVNSTDSWDAVWDGNAAIDGQGWTAELAIPLRVLRFPQTENQVWGIDVRRVIPRTHETLDSTWVPRNANPGNPGAQMVSRLGQLVDLVGLTPKRDLELAPYVAARLNSRPLYSDPSRPHPALLDPNADVGLDLKSALTSSLNLTVTVNPDFGQVEADQIIQNTSTIEQFFPEKRPFFTQGLDLFQPVGSEYGNNQPLFYSRRIGLAAPILAAAKLTGSIREGTEIGILDAVVMGAANPSLAPVALAGGDLSAYEGTPDRRWQYHLVQPLHFGPNDALPAMAPVMRNQLAAVVRQQIGPRSSVGAIFTSALPLAPKCRREQFTTDEAYEAAGCNATGGNAAALDWDLRTKDGVWGFFGQVDASQEIGGPAEGRVNADGTLIKPGDLGWGTYFRFGKFGGDGFRADINGVYQSPKLDLNHLGFQSFSNYQWYDLNLHYVRPSGWGPFRSVKIDYTFDQFNWSSDGRWIPRGANHSMAANLQLPSFDSIVVNAGYENAQYDYREIPFTGIPFERTSDAFVALGYYTDQNRPVFGHLTVVGIRFFGHGPVAPLYAWSANADLTWHPAPFLETYLSAEVSDKSNGARYLGGGADGQALFGHLQPAYSSLTLRQQVVLSPRLTLQAYAQLFAGTERYTAFYQASLLNRDKLNVADLAPIAPPPGNYDSHFSALNVNVVLRWEYRLGSTLYAVYTRSQQELPAPMGVAPDTTILPSRLGLGPVNQTAMIKWSYWWDV